MNAVPAIDVVVPSYGRPDAVSRCLEALLVQSVAPNRVIVAVHDTDVETRARVAERGSGTVCSTLVAEPGVVAAMRAGVAQTRAEVVAFTDDDARPRPDWIERIGAWFTRPDVGAVGGRDVQSGVSADRSKVVGRMLPFGRMTGSHHVGAGSPTDVDVLKGVNYAVRADALVLPRPGVLDAVGTAPHHELLICDGVRRGGWRVVYDPAIVVDHDVLPRVDSFRLGDHEDHAVVRAVACNRIAAATALDRRRLPMQLGYGVVVGTRESPGLLRAGLAALRNEGAVAARLPWSLTGQLAGAWRVCMLADGPVESCAQLRSGT